MKKTLLLSLFVALTIVASAQTQRMALLEHFTSASCGPCAAANPNIEQYFNTTSSNVISIKYQGNFGFDPLETVESTARVGYYGVTGFPTSVIGGTNQGHPNSFFAGGVSPTMDARSNVPSDFEISILPSVSADLSNIDVNVLITAKNNVNNPNLLAHIVVVEKAVTFSTAPGSNGETVFHNAMRKMLPSDAGTPLQAAFTTGQNIAISESWTPTNVYRLDDVAIVVFIQDDVTREVYQAGYADNIGVPTNIQNADLETSNPAALVAGDYCDGTYVPSVDVKNNSNTNLSTVDVSYNLNGTAGPIQTITLNAGQTSTVTFPGITVANGDALSYSTIVSDAGFGDLVPVNNNSAPAPFVLLDPSADNGVSLGFDFQGLTPLATFASAGVILDNPDAVRAVVIDNTVVDNFDVPLGGNGNSNGTFWWDFYGIQSGSAQLVFEEVDLSGALGPVLNFTYAHMQYQTENDRMIVKISSDCGATWDELFNKAGSDLATAGAQTAPFFAEAGDWEDVSIPILDYAGMSDVVIAFEGISAYGNSLFLDDINLTGVVSTENVALETSLNVFPNPAVDNFNVAFELTEAADLEINLVNSIGQTLRTIETGSFVAGEHILNVNTADLATGIYFVTIRNGAGVTTKTVTVQK